MFENKRIEFKGYILDTLRSDQTKTPYITLTSVARAIGIHPGSATSWAKRKDHVGYLTPIGNVQILTKAYSLDVVQAFLEYGQKHPIERIRVEALNLARELALVDFYRTIVKSKPCQENLPSV